MSQVRVKRSDGHTKSGFHGHVITGRDYLPKFGWRPQARKNLYQIFLKGIIDKRCDLCDKDLREWEGKSQRAWMKYYRSAHLYGLTGTSVHWIDPSLKL
jgi:hypothetical protein